MKKVFTVLLSLAMLCPSTFLYAQDKTLSLAQMRAKYEQDWTQLKNQYGDHHAQNLLLGYSLLLTQAKQEAAILADRLVLREDLPLTKHLAKSQIEKAAKDLELLKNYLRKGELEAADKLISKMVYVDGPTVFLFKDIVTSDYSAYQIQNLVSQFPISAAMEGHPELFFVPRDPNKRPVIEFEDAWYNPGEYRQGAVAHYNEARSMLEMVDKNKGIISNKNIHEDIIYDIRSKFIDPNANFPLIDERELIIEDIVKNYESLEDESFLREYFETLAKRRQKEIARWSKYPALSASDYLDGLDDAMRYNLLARNKKWHASFKPDIYKSKFFIKGLLPALLILVTAGLLSNQTEANAEDLQLLARLQNNMDLFFSASPQQLELLEQYELSNKFCRQQVSALHKLAQMDANDASSMLNHAQQRHVKQELVKSLKTVPAR